MSQSPSGPKPVVTRAGVLHLFSRSEGVTMTQTEIGARFGVSAQAAGNVVQMLLSTGELILAKKGGKNGNTLYYALSTAVQRPVLAPAARFNAWTRPMQGYEARLRSFAERALATRR